MPNRLITNITEIEDMLAKMCHLVEMMTLDAKQFIQTNDRALAVATIKRDEHVNLLDQEINEMVLHILATQAPVARDLRELLSIIRVATDVERLGDYAKTVAEFVIVGKPMEPPYLDIIVKMLDLFIEMFRAAVQAFVDSDVTKAYDIAAMDENIDAQMKIAFNTLSSIQHSDVKSMAELMQVFNIIRAIERAGDHTKNICEATVFKVKGKKIDLG